VDRKTWYFKKLVTTQFVEDTFDFVENAVDAAAKDLGALGISDGGLVTQHSPSANLSIDIQPLIARDVNGKRIYLPTLANLLVDVDSDSIPTNPTGPTFEKWLGIFVKHVKKLEDPTTDGNGDTVFVTRRDWYEFKVVQGAQALVGAAVMPVSPGVEWVRICDVLRHHDSVQNTVLNADIDYTLRDDRTVANADEVAYDDLFNRYPPAVETVADALDLVRLDQQNDELTIQSILTEQAELLNRYYAVGATDIRLYLDPDANLLYSMKGELYATQDISIATDGTRICLVFETTEDGITRKIIARLFNPGASTYDDERLIARGNVRAPKVTWCGTTFGITWLTEPDAVGAPGDYQINMRKLSPSNVLTGATVSNVNGYLTRPLRPEDDVTTQRRLYDIAYDTGTDKMGLVFSFDNQVFFRAITVGSETLGSNILLVDDSGSTSDDYSSPTIASGNADFGVSYVDTTDSKICFRAVEPVGAIEAVASPERASGVITDLLTDQNYIAYSPLNNYFVITTLNTIANVVDLYRVDSAYAAIASYTTFNGGGVGLVERIYGITYNTASNLLFVTFADSDIPQKIVGKETTDLAPSGGTTQFNGSTDDYHQGENVTSAPLKLGSNYYVLTSEPELSAPFNIRKFRQIAVPQLSTGVLGVVTEWRQGSGGYLTYLLRQNARKIIKYQLTTYDGGSVALADKNVISFLVAPSMFTDSVEQVLIDPIEPADTTTLVVYANTLTEYNQPFAVYRHDEALGTGGLVIGNSCYSAGGFRVWNPTKADVDIAQFLDEQAAVDARLDLIEDIKSNQGFMNLLNNHDFQLSTLNTSIPDFWAQNLATTAMSAGVINRNVTITGTAASGGLRQTIYFRDQHTGHRLHVKALMKTAFAGAGRIIVEFYTSVPALISSNSGDPIAADSAYHEAEFDALIPSNAAYAVIQLGEVDLGENVIAFASLAGIGEFIDDALIVTPHSTSPAILSQAGDASTPTVYHHHDGRYYTETELNTSGAGGQVHWENVSNMPVWVEPIYDIVVNRADYASDALAGTALKTIIEGGLYESIFIGNGVYDIGAIASGIGLDVSVVVDAIVGESREGVIIRATPSVVMKFLQIEFDGVFGNFTLEFMAGSASGGNTGVFGFITTQAFVRNVYVKYGMTTTAADIGFDMAFSTHSHITGCKVTGLHFGTAYTSIGGSVTSSECEWTSICFFQCINVSGVSIFNNANSSAVTSIAGFSGCENISNVLCGAQTGSLAACTLFQLFSNCVNVSSVYWLQSGGMAFTAAGAALQLARNCTSMTNIVVTTAGGSVNFTAWNTGEGMIHTCNQIRGLTVSFGIVAFGTTTQFPRIIRASDHIANVYVSISATTGTYTQLFGFSECDILNHSYLRILSAVAGTTATTHLKIAGANSCNQVSNVHVSIDPTTAVGSGFLSCNGVSMCLAETVAGTPLDRGMSDCLRVTGSHVYNPTTSYQNCTGVGNTNNGGGGGVANTALAGFTAASAETAPTIA